MLRKNYDFKFTKSSMKINFPKKVKDGRKKYYK